MKLPDVYVCFQAMGKDTPTVEAVFGTKQEAASFCMNSDFIPKSGWWFYQKFTSTTDDIVSPT